MLYVNFGDVNFFENGILVDIDYIDNVYPMLLCKPYPDAEDKYIFGDIEVAINDSWIDRKAVMDFIGMTEKSFDPLQFAIGCTEYYSWDNFGAIAFDYDWQNTNRKTICKVLQKRRIASAGLNIEWQKQCLG